MNLTEVKAIVARVVNNGSAFAYSEDGRQVYIPRRIAHDLGMEEGDAVTLHCIPNPMAEKAEAVPLTTVRATVDRPFSDREPVAQPAVQLPAVIPTETPKDLQGRCLGVLAGRRRFMSTKQVAAMLNEDRLHVSNVLWSLHNAGEVVALRFYRCGGQERASSMFYAIDDGVLEEEMGG